MPNLIDVIALSKKQCSQPISCELVYATPNNFVGRPLAGYHSNALDFALLTPNAAEALCQAQNFLLKKFGVSIYIYDTYRPKRAVLDIAKWSKLPAANDFELSRKQLHFPHIGKEELFARGYVAEDSNHCYGNTVDLVLMDLKTKTFLDFGTIFDYMDELSHLTVKADHIGEIAYQNRLKLVDAMVAVGFEPYEKEFWHFCHGGIKGREITAPLDIEITQDLRGIGVER